MASKLMNDLNEEEAHEFVQNLMSDMYSDDNFVYICNNAKYVVVTDGKLDKWATEMNKYVSLMEQGKIPQAYASWKWSGFDKI